jgi:hypothetical protein
MLFKEIHLKGIKTGAINLAFRKWKKLSITKGTQLKTTIGLVEITEIEVVNEKDITDLDIKNAGFENKTQLEKALNQAIEGNIYKIGVCYHSEDPRIKLREQTELTQDDYQALKMKLTKLDKSSKQGNWTAKILLTIKNQPNRVATEIAKLTDFEKEWLKLNIRKLKNLGLTISHKVGYEISPLGKLFIERQLREGKKY